MRVRACGGGVYVHACVQGTGQAYQVLSSEGYDVFIIQDVFY